MIQTIFYIKFIITIIVFIRVALKAVKSRSEQNTLFFLVLFFLLLIDLKRLSGASLPSDLFSEVSLLLLIGFMGLHAFKIRGIDLDYKELFSLEVFKGIDQLVAILKKDNLDVIASNDLFKKQFQLNHQFITINDIVGHIHSGKSEIEVLDFNNERRFYKASLKSLGLKHVILYLEDVTAYENLEHLLSEEDRYYKTLWDSAPNLIMIRTLWGEVVYMNEAMARFTAKSSSQLLGQHYSALYVYPDEAQAHEKCQRGLSEETDEPKTGFLRYTTERGHVKFFEAIESIIVHQNAKHIITTGVDCTVNAHTELLLKSYEAVQRLSGSNSNYPVVVLDFMSNDLLFIERINKYLDAPIESYKTFVKGIGQVQYKRLLEFYNAPEGFEPFELVYEGDKSFYVEQLFSEEHGFTIGALLKFITPLQSAVSITPYSGLILNHINEGLLLINFEGEIEFVNDYLIRRLGFSKEELLVKKLYDITKGLTKEMMRRSWVLSKEHASLHFNRVYLTKTGEEIEVEVVTVHTEEEKLLLLVREIGSKVRLKSHDQSLKPNYAHLFQSIDHQMLEVKLPDKHVVFYNAFDENDGLIGSEMSFLQWLNDIHDYDRSLVYEHIDTIMLFKKEGLVFEYRYFKGGEWQWLRANGKYNETDNVPSILIATQNITELKKMTNKLEDSRRILQESERIAQMAHWKYDVVKNQFQVSGTFSRLIGVNIFSGVMHYEQLLEAIEWTDRAYFENHFKWFVWHNKTLDVIVRIAIGDDMRFIHFLGQIYQDDDRAPVYAIGTVANVTDRIGQKKSLESEIALYHHMHDHSPIGMALILRNGDVKRVNPALRKILSLEKINHDSLKNVLVEKGLDDAANRLKEKLSKPYQATGKDKETLTLAPVFDEETRYVGNQLLLNIKNHPS